MSRVLAIGDIHEPVSHPGYIHFVVDMYNKWQCDKVVFIGDIMDWHGISFHARNPEAPGVLAEYDLAHERIQQWSDTFPDAKVCIGNHDERIIRLGESVDIPKKFMRNFNEVWDTQWDWDYNHIIDDVYYFHGVGCGGLYPAPNAAKKMLMSVVMGHVHGAAGVKHMASKQRRVFGLDTGCGIDDKAYAFAYGKHHITRSILGCGIVIDGVPYHEVMPIGKGEKYHRSNF
jgi:hypothetical protein